MTRTLALAVLLALGLTACPGCSHKAPPQPGASPAAPAQPAPSAQSAPAQEPAAASQPAESATQQATGSQESGGGTETQERSDTSLEQIAAPPPTPQLPGWQPGVNYDPVVPGQPTSVAPGQVEVLEVFWLGCPHCYALEPYIRAWLKTKPAYIGFVRVPVMWQAIHRAHAHLFYTLQALGRPDLIEKAFDTIQHQQSPLASPDDAESLGMQQAFAVKNGISADDYKNAYNSFSVASDLQRAEELTQRYHVDSVPFIVVNGKYSTDVGKAGGPEKLIKLINDLAAFEHRQ
jgi:protein dithiol oxidoreductase (disulfide-forming)